MREYVRNFPDNRRWGSLETQLKHASGEIVEAMGARNFNDVAMELFDAMECLEGALVKLSEVNEIAVMRAYKMHLKKQEERGDYV